MKTVTVDCTPEGCPASDTKFLYFRDPRRVTESQRESGSWDYLLGIYLSVPDAVRMAEEILEDSLERPARALLCEAIAHRLRDTGAMSLRELALSVEAFPTDVIQVLATSDMLEGITVQLPGDHPYSTAIALQRDG